MVLNQSIKMINRKIKALRIIFLKSIINSLSLIIVLVIFRHFNIFEYGNRPYSGLIIESVIAGIISSLLLFFYESQKVK